MVFVACQVGNRELPCSASVLSHQDRTVDFLWAGQPYYLDKVQCRWWGPEAEAFQPRSLEGTPLPGLPLSRFQSLCTIAWMEPVNMGGISYQWAFSLLAMPTGYRKEAYSPGWGPWVYEKGILRGNCVLRIHFGYLFRQGQLEGDLITQ